jgi:hypothetical protein
MPNRPPFPLPCLDPAPIKDVARSLRFVAERGGRTLKQALPLDALPEPAARLAEGAMATVERLGATAQRGVSGLAHSLLDLDATPPPLAAADADAEARFAVALQSGLTRALSLLGAESTLVSEAAAARAWRQVMAAGPGGDQAAAAAALHQALLAAGVVREVVWPEDATLPLPEARALAVFAVLLAMQGDPGDFDNRLAAATDMALALRADLGAADATTLAALFAEFHDHV